MSSQWKPVQGAPVAYQDEHIIVYKDGTWKPTPGHEAGWDVHGDAVVYGNASDNVRITTAWGHSKASIVTYQPTGRVYDVRTLAGS